MPRTGKLAAMPTSTTPIPRLGRREDAAEFVRLRRLMFQSMGANLVDQDWEAAAADHYRSGLEDGSLLAVVVDQPDGERLAATGVATLATAIPSPLVPDGRKAYISSMCTDVGYRRQGLARVILDELIACIEAAGIRWIDLHATDDGMALYRSFGFAPRPYPHLGRYGARKIFE